MSDRSDRYDYPDRAADADLSRIPTRSALQAQLDTIPAAQPGESSLAPAEVVQLERAQTRDLLEGHIGLDVVLEALEYALVDELDIDPATGEPPEPSRFRRLYDLMLSPTMTPFSVDGRPPRARIDTLLAKSGVRVPELLHLIGSRNLVLALTKSSSRLETVIDGIAEAAEPKSEPCRACLGGPKPGYVEVGIVDESGMPTGETRTTMCSSCLGKGTIRLMGDLQAAKLFVGLHGGNTSGKGGTADGRPGTTINVGASAIIKSDKPEQAAITTRVGKIIDG